MSPHAKTSSLWDPFAPSKATFNLRVREAEDLHCLAQLLQKWFAKSDPFTSHVQKLDSINNSFGWTLGEIYLLDSSLCAA